MNAKAREIAGKLGVLFVEYALKPEGDDSRGEAATVYDKAESIIAEALAEQDKEIARLREAIEYALRQEGRDNFRLHGVVKNALQRALLPPDEKEAKTCATCGLDRLTQDNAHACDSETTCMNFDKWEPPDAKEEER